MAKAKYDFNAAWKHLLSIKKGDGGYYGFDAFFTDQADKNVARYLLAEAQGDGIYALFCEDFFVEEINSHKPSIGQKDFRAVLDEIVARTGEWKRC